MTEADGWWIWSGGVQAGGIWVELYCMTHVISFTGVDPSIVRKCADGCAVFMELLACVYVCVYACACVCDRERERT